MRLLIETAQLHLVFHSDSIWLSCGIPLPCLHLPETLFIPPTTWLNEENTITLVFVKKVSCHPGRDSSMLVCLESCIIDHVGVHPLCYSWQPPAKCISC